MTKTTKTKAAPKAKKATVVKAAAAKKPVTALKVTVKGSKTTVRVTPTQSLQKKAAPLKVKNTEIAAPKIVAPAPVVEKKIEKLDFVAGDFVVYPAHGVGQVEGVEVQTIAGMSITLYTICF